VARHWDDIELLRTIDRFAQESPGVMRDGRTLMEAVAGESVPDERDQASFIHELHLAREAGYLTFRPVEWAGMPSPDPSDPNMYLQRTTDFALTLSGRDRARGRLIEVPPPEADEDDGRPVGLMTVEAIARGIGDAYTGEQLPRFLEDSGLPREAIPPFEGTKWRYVADVLTTLLGGGAAARRSAREFLGSWLDHRLHSGPTRDDQARLLSDLARQGWHIRDGRLVIGERVIAEPAAAALAGEATLAQLHPRVRAAADPLYRDGHRSAAVFEAYKTVERRVRELTGRSESARALMAKTFDQDAPLLPLNDGVSVSDRDEQEGFKLLFMGAMQGVRNPKAHDLFDQLAEERALDYLAFASLLMRRLDDAEERLKQGATTATSSTAAGIE
jgi:uncharacterized protein (TIGR02391 family)